MTAASPACPLVNRPRFAPAISTVFSRFERSLTGVGLTLALAVTATATPHAPAQAAKVPSALPATAIAETATRDASLEQVYLYGQSPIAGQIGSTYVVFAVQGDQVTGGFYMPYSSFDCFQGQIEDNQLNLNVLSTYDQTSYAYTVELEPSSSTASAEAPSVASLQPIGFHPIETLSSTDQQVLSTCRALNLPQI